VSREEAKHTGARFYFTGLPCKRGHVSVRQTSNATCYECSKEKGRIRASSKEGKEKRKEYLENNPEKLKVWKKTDREKNKKKYSERNKTWRENNREHLKEYLNEYYRTHPEYKPFHNNLRRARKIQACPKWVNRNDLRKVYQSRPNGFHVDHIVPLKSYLVCGLHVPWNLQILSKVKNELKSNTYVPEHYVREQLCVSRKCKICKQLRS
jgi:hypothetical protein